MSDVNELVEGYLAMWNETDPVARSVVSERIWESDATYTDPLVVAEGREVIESVVGGVQEQVSGAALPVLGLG